MFEKINDYAMPGAPKKPKGAGQCVLYLDFDGVLHHENCLWHPKRGAYLKAPARYKLFQHAQLLAEVLKPHPQWLIVLSTSWAVHYSCSKAAKRLPAELRKRVIGATYHSQMHRNSFERLARGLAVVSDVRRRLPAQWIALDDNSDGWPAWCGDRFIQTHQYEGISDPDVLDRLKNALEKYTC